MADLIQSVEDMLKEATWTRAAISNYKESDIKALANIVEQANKENCLDQIYDICAEQLVHSKDSIIALYVCGVTDLKKGVLDNSNLETLVDIFLKNHKENVVVSLCQDILADDSTNRFALRTLADCYAADPDQKDKVWDIYATLVKIDFEEALLAKALGEHFEAEAKTDEANQKVLLKTAIEYYKKAILRFINQNNYNGVKEVWAKLIELMPSEFDFFQLLRRKIAKSMGENKTTNLMQDLYEWYKENKKWKIAITILKQNLEVDPTDTWARNQIIECYRGRYEGHSQLEEYIRSSNLGQSYRNVFEAINDFEKHIAFDKGSFVFHRNWGVGKIRKLEGDSIEINFGKVSTGALNDLERVTKQAIAMVSFYGMSSDIGNLSYYNSTDDYGFTKPYSDKTAEKIDADVKAMVEEQYERAKEVLRNNMEGLTQLAETLLEKEVIFSDDLERIFGKRKGENKALDAINEAKEQEKAEAEKQTADADVPSTSSGSDGETKNKNNEISES